jgi:hypothetical protein
MTSPLIGRYFLITNDLPCLANFTSTLPKHNAPMYQQLMILHRYFRHIISKYTTVFHIQVDSERADTPYSATDTAIPDLQDG